MRQVQGGLMLWGLCVVLSQAASAAPIIQVYPNPRAGTSTAAAAQDPYLVGLPSRALTPRGRADVASARDEKVFIQFQRTLKPEEQDALEESGVVFHESLEPFTYLVSMSGAAAEAVQRHPLFLGAESIQPADKMTASMLKSEIPGYARRPDEGIAVFFRFYDDVTLDQALAALDAAGILVADRSVFLFAQRLEAVGTRDAILAACGSPAVRAAYEMPPPPVMDNTQAAGFSNVPALNIAPYGLNGSGIAVGIWDGGQIRSTHQDLSPRITIREFDQPMSEHSTHVAGTVLGTGATDASSKGMAPSATAFSYDFDGDIPTEQSNSAKLPPTGDGIALSNNSWAVNIGWTLNDSCFWQHLGNALLFGSYDSSSGVYDDLIRKKRLMIVKSAGNAGTECGPSGWCGDPRSGDCDGVLASDGFRYDNIDPISSAKNVLAVGALNDDGTTKTDFSSCGPADDGRVKPDVVANGYQLNSTGAGSDTEHVVKSGTSMAAPVVSGVVALIDEEWKKLHASRSSAINKPAPELVKALLVNTAVDLGRPGPDYAYGHGLVKAKDAVDQLQLPNVPGGTTLAPDRVRTAFISEGEALTFRVSTPAGPTGTIRTTIAWDDLYGTSGSVVRYCNFINLKIPCTSNADCTPLNPLAVCDAAPCGTVACHLKNDLDSLLWNAPGNALIGFPYVPPGAGAITSNAFTYVNHVDNVEAIQSSDSNGGELLFTVFGFTVTGGQQRFTLAANKKVTFFPANDSFANARALPALIAADATATDCPSGQFPCPATLYPHNTWDAVNFDATTEPQEPANIPPVSQQHSVWYTWVAPSNGQATFDTAGADFDTTLAVWTGSSLAGLTTVGANDDFYGRQSKVSFVAVAGTTYRIQVRGWAGGIQDASHGVFPLNYYLIVCGNSVTEAGETCDDGNTTNGDCCSSTCAPEAAGSACTINGDYCNVGTCSGSTCTNIAPRNCDDHNSCTSFEFCAFGACVIGPPPAVPESTPTIGMTSRTHLSWPALAGVPEYDVVRGSLSTLRSSAGNFSTATTTCLADSQPITGIDDASSPTVGNGFFYLVRGTSCSGSGTYDTTSPKQVASRDAGVEAAPITCATVCVRGKCTGGPPLDPQCDACTVALCGVDPHCCNAFWDNQCIQEVRTMCGSLTCQESAGTCAHPVCTVGGALVAGCDNPPLNPSCVATICAARPSCCSTAWDAQCAANVGLCGWNCN